MPDKDLTVLSVVGFCE